MSKRKEHIPHALIFRKAPAGIKDSDVMVTLLNMGGPKTNDDVLAFQAKLFNDRRLIRFPLSSILQPFFAWALVTFRGKASQERYQLIGGGRPIYQSVENQVAAVKQELKKRGRNFDVTYSFNYTPPFPEDTIREIKQAGKKYILPLSLYPHYSSATTGSNLYYLKEAAQRIYPELQFLDAPSYHLHEGYVQGFVGRIQESLKAGESLNDFYLIFSAHGLPKYFLDEGDPYAFEIAQTVGAIVTRLKRSHSWVIAFQSAVGPIQWLEPNTETIITALAKRGIKKILVIPVSFVGDHIETTCEIDMEYRKVAVDSGIEDYRMTKALECHPDFIRALGDTAENALRSAPGAGKMDAKEVLYQEINVRI